MKKVILDCLFKRDGKETIERYEVNADEEDTMVSSFDESDGELVEVYYGESTDEKFECADCGCYFWVKDRNDFDCPNCETQEAEK